MFIPGSVEWIYKSATAIFSQPTFLTNIWTALFEKETLKGKPPRLTFSKMPRIWKNKSAEMSCVHFTRLLDLLWHDLKKFQELRILRKSCENRDFFLEQVWSSGRRILYLNFFSCAIISLKFLYSGNPLSIQLDMVLFGPWPGTVEWLDEIETEAWNADEADRFVWNYHQDSIQRTQI